MGKRFWSLALSSALVAGVFAIAPARAAGAEMKFFLGSTGCSAADVNFDFLTVTDADHEIECNYTGSGIRNEIGAQTGTIGAQGQNAVTDRETATRYWDTIDGGPIALDASRSVTGSLFTMGASCVNALVPCSPVGVSLGTVVLEIEFVGYVGETETILGAQTDTFDVTPGAPHETKVDIKLDAAAAGKTFDRVELRTWNHGESAGHGMIKTNGDFSSFISVPTGGAIISDPGKPSKPKPPTTGKDCGKGKSKGKGNGPKKCPTKPKPPKTPKPAPGCAPIKPSEDGAEAKTSTITDAATEAAPVVVEYTAEPGGPSSPVGGPVDLRSFLFHNIQVDSASPNTGLYVKAEFTENHDYDLGLFHSDGTEAASSGESQPEPGLGAGSPEGAWEGGPNYEMLKGIGTNDCAGYTARVAGYLTTGGPVTISMWLGPVIADPAAPGGAQVTAADMFFNAAKMRNPMTADSAQASGTPAANKGCKKGKGKKKGCLKPPVACAPFAPGDRGKDKPTVIVTDAATEAAPVEQKVNLAASLGDARQGPMPAEGPFAESYDYYNVQVDSASPNKGLYVLFEFPERRDYDLELLNIDGSYAARSHDFNPVCGSPVDCSNGGVGGEAGTAFEKLVGINTADCGGWTIETVNWLGEGGEMTVKMWLGDVVNEPQAPGTEPHV